MRHPLVGLQDTRTRYNYLLGIRPPRLYAITAQATPNKITTLRTHHRCHYTVVSRHRSVRCFMRGLGPRSYGHCLSADGRYPSGCVFGIFANTLTAGNGSVRIFLNWQYRLPQSRRSSPCSAGLSLSVRWAMRAIPLRRFVSEFAG